MLTRLVSHRELHAMTPSLLAVERQLSLAFAPLDKRAMGLACGIVMALALSAATGFCLLMDPEHRFPLDSLSAYFVGYRVSLPGLLIGASWMFFSGFIWGWFLAFCRNLVLALWIIVIRVRADVDASRNVLEHI